MTLTRPNYHNGTTIQIQIVINIEQFNIQVTESNNRPVSKVSHVRSSRHQFAVAHWLVVLQQFAVANSSLLSTVRRYQQFAVGVQFTTSYSSLQRCRMSSNAPCCVSSFEACCVSTTQLDVRLETERARDRYLFSLA